MGGSPTFGRALNSARGWWQAGATGLTLLPPDGCAGGVVGRERLAGAAAGEAGR